MYVCCYHSYTEDGEIKYLVSATKLSSHHERNTLTVSYQDIDTHNSELANRVLENYFRSVTAIRLLVTIVISIHVLYSRKVW